MYVQKHYICIANVLQTYYTSYMKQIKISKTFRLSQEAVDVLEGQSNATQFVEDLILQKAVGPQSGGDIENKLDTILEILSRPKPEVADINIGLPNITTADKIVSPTANRDLGTIRNDIQLLEDEMAQALEENQDPQYGRELNRRYTKQIDELWKEYHATKQTH